MVELEQCVMLHFAKEGLATFSTDVACPLDDHDILLAVGLVLKVVVHIRQRHLALHTAEASWVESPALIITFKIDKRSMRLVTGQQNGKNKDRSMII